MIHIVTFAGAETTKYNLNKYFPEMERIPQAFASGAIAGSYTLTILVPIDLMKVRGQIMKQGNINYRNEIGLIMKEQGFFGLYRGFFAAASRDIPGWATYFGMYEVFKSYGEEMAKIYPGESIFHNTRDFMWRFNAGGCAAVIAGIISHP